ncbi:cytochrome P450 2K4-like isoform 2-T2 [Pelodytes ibericus]
MFALDPISILVSVVIILFLLIIFYDRNGNIYKNFPPGPKPLPIIGNFHLLFTKKQEPHKVLYELSKKYGSVFSLQLGCKKMVVLCGYDTVKDALFNHADEFAERPAVPLIDEMANGHGIIFAHGENWKVMRRFTLTTLRDFGMGKKLLEDKISEETDSLVEEIKSYNGKPFDSVMILNAAVANIILSLLVGHRFDYQNPTFLKLTKLMNDNIQLFNSPMVLLFNAYPSVMRWIPGAHKKIVKNSKEMEKFFEDMFKKQRDELDRNDQRNLIDAFLVKQQEEKPNPELYFNNENLANLVGDLFAAGMESTSTTLRWGFLFMMKYPEIQKNVQNEIDRVIGSAKPQTEHRKEMPYTEAVINEIQRIGNIGASGVPRATTRDVMFRGYFLPKGTEVLPVLGTVLQDEAYFEKPEEFYPEHFLDSKGNYVKNEAFIPFSAGRRACAGENLAKMELFLFFTRLMQNFTFQTPPGVEVDLTPYNTGTRNPVMNVICALPRN